LSTSSDMVKYSIVFSTNRMIIHKYDQLWVQYTTHKSIHSSMYLWMCISGKENLKKTTKNTLMQTISSLLLFLYRDVSIELFAYAYLFDIVWRTKLSWLRW